MIFVAIKKELMILTSISQSHDTEHASRLQNIFVVLVQTVVDYISHIIKTEHIELPKVTLCKGKR